MVFLFYFSSVIGLVATLLAVTRANAFHALLYLVVSFLSVAVIFFSLGAPFVAVLEVIIYAGAIVVLFIFVVMLLNLGERATSRERALLSPALWIGPGILALLLLAEMSALLARSGLYKPWAEAALGPKAVGLALFGPYLLAVELASFVLLAGLVGAFHLGFGARGRGGAP